MSKYTPIHLRKETTTEQSKLITRKIGDFEVKIVASATCVKFTTPASYANYGATVTVNRNRTVSATLKGKDGILYSFTTKFRYARVNYKLVSTTMLICSNSTDLEQILWGAGFSQRL